MKSLNEILAACTALHRHLCPRQVLGARMGLFAGEILGLDLPQADKRLLVIVETDGCAADGISVATNCWVGRRTLRVEDYGKVAATFVDTLSKQAVRVAPHNYIRKFACSFAPKARNRWEAQLLGYQRMPESLLLSWRWVVLNTPVEALISRAGGCALCQACGEEIINEREVRQDTRVLCRACTGEAYYTALDPSTYPAGSATMPLFGGNPALTDQNWIDSAVYIRALQKLPSHISDHLDTGEDV